jgi:uncharacterized protein YutE (UPF0331/DUF86 family)
MNDQLALVHKAVLIEEFINQLSDYKDLSLCDYLADYRNQYVVERIIERMIECAVDINGIFIGRANVQVHSTYIQSFKNLVGLGFVRDPVLKNFIPTAQIRNRIIHEYDEVDNAEVFSHIKRLLKWGPMYLADVRKQIHLDQTQTDTPEGD